MSRFRKELIRAHFEAYRDLVWAETLEPKLRESGVDAAAMNIFRNAWNDYVEGRDWDWWKDETRRVPNEELDDQRMDCLDKLDALAILARQREWAKDSPLTLQEVRDNAAAKQDLSPERTQTHDRDRER
jgi:hypothetical protein